MFWKKCDPKSLIGVTGSFNKKHDDVRVNPTSVNKWYLSGALFSDSIKVSSIASMPVLQHGLKKKVKFIIKNTLGYLSKYFYLKKEKKKIKYQVKGEKDHKNKQNNT